MNRFVNSVMLFIAFVTFILAVFVGRDLPIGFMRLTGQFLPYKEVYFIVLAALMLVIGGRRSVRRWTGILMVRKKERYQLNFPVGKGRRSRALFYLIVEGFVHFIMALMIMFFTKYAFPVFLVLVFLGIDHFMYAIIGRFTNAFRVGITKAAVVTVDRDVRVVYFSALRRVSVFQHEIYFEYIHDFVLDIPANAIDDEHKEAFKETLVKQLNPKKVFVEESFKKL